MDRSNYSCNANYYYFFYSCLKAKGEKEFIKNAENTFNDDLSEWDLV